VYEHLRLEEHDGIVVVRIDRPPANALDRSLLAEGHSCLEGLTANRPRAVVITGREGYFSAGVDLKLAPTLDRDGQREMVEGINRLFAGWYGYPGPVVCAVNGHAIAGGMILALCGDYRVGVTGEARFGLTELKVGAPYPAAALAVVRAELPAPAARRLVLGAGLVGPEAALELGVLDELGDGDPLSRALEVAGELAEFPPATYELVKAQLRGETIAAARRALQTDPLLDDWLADESAEASAAVLQPGEGG
jgi:enoyl-CoA hydratase/carnithine racemase